MSSDDFRQTIERVKLAAPIEEVVRLRVPELKRAGAEWKACCPFHAEKTPSFSVNPAKGIWHCFGACSTGGDAIAFVQRFDGLEFIEALELLAGQYGIELPKQRRGAGDGRFERLHEVLERAAVLYQRKLAGPDGVAARAYLASRKLAGATAEAFGLGWAPEQGNPLVEAATQGGIHERLLLEAGLARRRERGDLYDFFHGRLMIPIRDAAGRVVGFGGRLLPGAGRDGPKYVNTPETPLFHKGRLVFGLDRALVAARRERHLVLVEGYTDVMAAHQVGLGHVVAVLGTSTTEEHARLVRRTGATRVSLVFDGDEAGRKAASRALHGLLPLGAFELDVVALVGGEDPADLVLRAGAEGFRAALASARPWFDFLVDGLVGLEPAALAERVDDLLSVVARLPQPVHQEALVRELAARLALPEAAVRAQWDAHAARRTAPPRPPLPTPGNPAGGSHVQGSAPQRPAGAANGAAAGADRAAAAADVPAPPAQRPERALLPQERRRASRVRVAYGELAGAVLLDNSLFGAYRGWLLAAGERLVASGGDGLAASGGVGLAEGALRSPVGSPPPSTSNSTAPNAPHAVDIPNDERRGAPHSFAPASVAPASVAPAAGVLERSGPPPCPDPVVARLVGALVTLLDEDRVDADGYPATVDASALLTALAGDPAAALVTGLVAHAARAESATLLAEGAVATLGALQRSMALSALRIGRDVRGDRAADCADDSERARLTELDRLLRARRTAGPRASADLQRTVSNAAGPLGPDALDDEPPF